ncbi:deoxyguanosinetriphosphate triphosphohydrolase [Planctomycetaceae bacterium SCGC AG-212-F19]|nr:deoxyguanosinetriphosphate triphosphohydrolase [Planctomycetaceae bacterium SCGC AG-212-F19]
MTAPFQPLDWHDWEAKTLAPYAMHTGDSRGRRHPEPPHPFRTLYQRDRDRIVHSTAFRRLMHKTQVLVSQTNDHHRTRLTHTLEVAQISRTIARQLGLNEDLTEATALAHDLGHPPFGHAGEKALAECMAAHGGFEHNRHGLRILEQLEYRYADFPGLNLSWEVLEAQAFHSKCRDAPEIQAYTGVGQPLLEAQLVDAADSLAYDTHDLDDALAVGLIALADLDGVRFWQRAVEQVRRIHPRIGPEQFQPTVVRFLINWQVSDLLEHTRQQLRKESIATVADVRGAAALLVAQGPEVQAFKEELETFLHQRVYNHYRVQRMAAKGRRFLTEMFTAFCRTPQLLPERYQRRVQSETRERVVCDYLAGMTDRYAQNEYLRLFQPFVDL